MCTWINERAPVEGSGKGSEGWFHLSEANVGYDHPFHASFQHAILVDFANPALGAQARVAVELNLASARALAEALDAAIVAAEKSGAPE